MPTNRDDIRPELGLRQVINVSGTMTSLGASIVAPEAVDAVRRILSEFVEIGELHRKASAVIAAATGGEAGAVTASASAGVPLRGARRLNRARPPALPRPPGPSAPPRHAGGVPARPK